MERQLLGGKIIATGEYTVMMAWSDGADYEDIGRTERIMDFETLDDVRKMRDVLNDMLERWGDDGKSAETDADTGSDGRRVQGRKESDSVHRRLGAAEKGSVYAETESKQ